jgi:hypothetical protein
MMRSQVGLQSIPAAVGIAAMGAYLPTLAPTISWHNGGVDSGDLAAAVASFGVPHPPGYPGYMLLARLWTSLPFGADLAYRLNLLSAVGAALATGLCAATIISIGRRRGFGGVPLAVGAAFGGLTFALAPLTWSQATITEVYAPGMVSLALVTLLALGWQGRPSRCSLLIAGLVGGFGFGMLPQIVLTVPGVAIAALVGARLRVAVERLGLLALGTGIGLSSFLYLPISAATRPLVNWGDPSSPERFWAVVTVQMYHGMFDALGPVDWLRRVLESMALAGHDIGGVGLVFGMAGAWALGLGTRMAGGYILGLVLLTLAFRAGYRAEGNEVYLLPLLYGVGLLVGVGAVQIAERLRRSSQWAVPALAVVLTGILIWRAAATMPTVDVSADYEADHFVRAALAALPTDAVLVSEHDATTFGLWYRQALGERGDVVVVDARLLPYPWYRDQLLGRYPDMNPAAMRPGGLTALERPIYVVANPVEEVVKPASNAARRSGDRSAGVTRVMLARTE